MAHVPGHILQATAALILFHLLFFRRFYFHNPYCYATSEPLEMEFPAARYLGEQLRQWKIPWHDPYYMPYYASQPILSTFYPPHMLVSIVQSMLPLDLAWKLHSLLSVLHFLFASIGAYLLFSGYGAWLAFFGAITLTYAGYSIKQNAPIIYTLSWMPWLLLGAETHNPALFGLSMGMGILAGYWPLWLYAVPFACCYWLLH